MFKVKANCEYKLIEEKIENDLEVEGKLYTLEVYPKTKSYFSNKEGSRDFKISLESDYSFSESSLVYANGYQSWTDTKEFRIDEKMKSLDKLPMFLRKHYLFDIYGDSYFYKYPNKNGVFHGYTISYIREEDDYLFIGSLNDHEYYTIIKSDATQNKIEIIPDLDVYIEKPTVVLKFVVLKGSRKVFDLYKSNGYKVYDFVNKKETKYSTLVENDYSLS